METFGGRVMKKSIIVRGPALSRSGYGEQCRFALRALRSAESIFDIFLINTNWGQTSWISEDNEERDWLDGLLMKTNMYISKTKQPQFDASLQVTIPNEWQPMAPINIGYTAGIETDKIAPQWIEKSMGMNQIITISQHSKNVFESTSYSAQNKETGEQIPDFRCKTPITVVNYPVREYEEVELDIDFSTEFNFLAVAQWGPRKNMENTVKWFVEEFVDKEVGLVLKTFKANSSTPDLEDTYNSLKSLLKKYPDRKCKVYLLHGAMSDAEMNMLYKHPKIKCLVTLTHGEGFGLPIFEAAYNGIPVIAPDWSGHTDFLYMPEKNKKGRREKRKPKFTKVEHRMGPIPEHAVWDGVLQADARWCYPEQGSYKMALRGVYKNISTVEKEAKKLQKWILENFTSEKKYEEFVDCITQHLSMSREEIDWNQQISQMQVL